MDQIDLARLRKILLDRFSDDELHTLCFDLGLDYEYLPGVGKGGKARELIKYLVRRERVSELIEIGRQMRPDIDWDAPLALPELSVPHNLPPRGEFVGREAEKADLHEALRSRVNLISIDGIGGIGKTSLALEVIYECLKASKSDEPPEDIATFEGFVWATAKDYDLTVNSLLDTIARVLGYPSIAQKPLAEKASSIRRLLRTKPYLLVVDNFETISDSESIYRFLLTLPEPSKAIVTTRTRSLWEGRMLSLEDMPEKEALALIRSEGRRLGLRTVEQASDEVLLRLYQSTSGAPLAIKWAVGQIKQRGRTLGKVLTALREAKASIYDNIFSQSWALLSPEAQRVIAVMPLFAIAAQRGAVEAASDIHGVALDESLGQLIEMSLLEADGELEAPRYRIHSLMRTFVTAQCNSGELAQFSLEAWERLIDYYRALIKPPESARVGVPYWDGLLNDARAPGLLEEWENLAFCIRRALDEEAYHTALDLFLPIIHFMNAWNLWDERLELGLRIAEAAEQIGDPAAAWLWVDGIEWIYLQRRQFEEAERALEKGRELATRLGEDLALLRASSYEARLAQEKGDTDLAWANISPILERIDYDEVLRSGNRARQIIVGRVYGSAAAVHRAKGDLAQAKDLFERELEFRRVTGEKKAAALSRLAHVNMMLGNVAVAEVFLDQASKNPGPKDTALIYRCRALLAERKGHMAEAQRYAEQAYEHYTWLGMEPEARECQELLDRLSSPNQVGRR